MTGYEVVEQALLQLNYTTPTGEPDNALNAEQIRRSLPVLNVVLTDILRIQGEKPVKVDTLATELPVADDVALLVAVPGVAMYLAHSENDGDNYNRFAEEYDRRRQSVPRGSKRVTDRIPIPEG